MGMGIPITQARMPFMAVSFPCSGKSRASGCVVASLSGKNRGVAVGGSLLKREFRICRAIGGDPPTLRLHPDRESRPDSAPPPGTGARNSGNCGALVSNYARIPSWRWDW